MRPLSTSELLSVWERGQARPPVERALALLAAACPEETPDALAGLSIGRRDALLLTLREWTFGPRLVSLAACPDCGERLEIDMAVSDIRVPSVGPAPERLEMTLGGYEIALRLPDSRDLAAMTSEAGLPALRQRLLDRCLLAVRHLGEEESLPEELAEAAVARLAEADPQADVQLDLSCPACGVSWLAAFDIVTFFWREIEAWAVRILREVHALARAYGWSEGEILSLSPQRRQIYLQMVGAG